MSDKVVQLSSLRLHSHLCDVTVQVAFHGELEEFEAQQVVLAASSGYFKNILLAPDPPKKLFLGNFAEDKIGVICEVATLLECKSLMEACSSVLDEGSSSPHGAKSSVSQDMERLYPCDVCTKTFKRKKDVTRLRRQVRTGLSRGIWDCFCSTFM
uniref:Heterogeneous nuclear ribonucleoprotein A0, like n=1 Tax=Salmo trutta TaxID=8032 RepID=A0A673WVQ1_SALTR